MNISQKENCICECKTGKQSVCVCFSFVRHHLHFHIFPPPSRPALLFGNNVPTAAAAAQSTDVSMHFLPEDECKFTLKAISSEVRRHRRTVLIPALSDNRVYKHVWTKPICRNHRGKQNLETSEPFSSGCLNVSGCFLRIRPSLALWVSVSLAHHDPLIGHFIVLFGGVSLRR